MIKLVCFLHRKPGMSVEEFHDHWLNSHGPLIANEPTLAKHLVRYEQNHRLEADYRRKDPRDFDGATVQWLESMESFNAFVREPAYAELIAPDEASFLDRGGLELLFTGDDDVKIDGGDARGNAGMKLLCLVKRKPGLSAQEFHEHWGERHGPLVAGIPEIAKHMIAYHQSHRTEKDYKRDPEGKGYDGLAEQWYASAAAAGEMVREPAYAAQITPDEDRFLDRDALSFVLCSPPDVIIGSSARG